MKKNIIFLFCFLFQFYFAQEKQLVERLEAIDTGQFIFYETDGMVITKRTFNNDFSEKGLAKTQRQLNIKNKEFVKSNVADFEFNNITFEKIENNYFSEVYYVFLNKDKVTDVYLFSSLNPIYKDIAKEFIALNEKNKIPATIFQPHEVGSSFNLLNDEIKTPGKCYFTNIRTLQCPYNGEINWSVFKDLESAKKMISEQYNGTFHANKSVKKVSEKEITVIFNGVETKAKKVTADITGLNSLLASTSGGKTLEIYYIAENIKGYNIGIVMSFWNNDNKTENGVAPLIDALMKIK